MFNILLRRLVTDDADKSFQWRNDSEVWAFTGSQPNIEITREIETEWIEKVLNDDSCKRFAILADGIYIGNIQFTAIKNSAAEYHIFIGDKSYWGKGIAQLATYQILHYAKEELHLTNVILSVNEQNISAVKTYLKTSFEIQSESNGWLKMNCHLENLPIPMVSVFVMVYNHDKYLKECLDGILMQRCNFNFNIIVGEDCSTDDSRKILLDYQTKYPGKFKILLHEKNIGAVKNQMAVFENCKGKYIALCEGDDYWTDPLKLQKQVDFLEANGDYVIHSAKAQILKVTNFKEIIGNPLSKTIYHISDFFTKNNLISCTVMLRNTTLPTNHLRKLIFGDWMFYILFLSQKSGNLAYVSEEIFSIYRVHDGGVMQTLTKKYDNDLAHLRQIKAIKKYLHCKYNKEDHNKINNYSLSVFSENLTAKNYKKCFSVIADNYSLSKLNLPLRNYLGLFKYHLLNRKNA